jgi:hypothetical protein
MNIARTTSRLLLCSVFAFASIPAAYALQSNAPVEHNGPSNSMPIPSPEGITGCWNADGALYGDYRLRFCVQPFGAAMYHVEGAGLRCSGALDWQENMSGRFGFTMSRTTCGHGTDWSADSFSCSLTPDDFDRRVGMMPVQGGSLECTYRPAVSGYSPVHFSAHRT